MGLPEIPEESVIEFPDGVPGLGELRRFVLLRPDDLGPIVLLQSVEDEQVSLPLVPAEVVHPEYQLRLGDAELRAISAERTDELAALAVVVLSSESGVAACNLFAPIVVNFKARIGRQILQADSDYPMVFPLTAG